MTQAPEVYKLETSNKLVSQQPQFGYFKIDTGVAIYVATLNSEGMITSADEGIREWALNCHYTTFEQRLRARKYSYEKLLGPMRTVSK